MWRWRRETYSFNLTIVHSEKELDGITSNNICEKQFIELYKKQLKIGKETINICQPNFSRNISMTSTG